MKKRASMLVPLFACVVILVLSLLALSSRALDLPVGSKADATMEQLRYGLLLEGYTNSCPIGVSKSGVVINNPTGVKIADNHIVSISAARAGLAAFRAYQANLLLTTTNR